MKVGQRVIELLRKKGLEQKELALFLGTKPSTVNGWKAENRNPSCDAILPICEFLDVSPTFLLSGKEDTENSIGQEWIDIIAHIPEEKQDMCKDFLRTHMVIPEKYVDEKRG